MPFEGKGECLEPVQQIAERLLIGQALRGGLFILFDNFRIRIRLPEQFHYGWIEGDFKLG